MQHVMTPGAVSLDLLEQVWRTQEPAVLDPGTRTAVDAAADIVRQAAEGEAAVYGVNTGFGKLAHVKIAAKDTAALQRNLILSHCCGVSAGCTATDSFGDDCSSVNCSSCCSNASSCR